MKKAKRIEWYSGKRAYTSRDVDAWATYRKALFTRNIMRATRLRKARLAAELTQRQVAEEIGTTPQAYGYWESGHRHLSTEVVNEAIKAMSKGVRRAEKAERKASHG